MQRTTVLFALSATMTVVLAGCSIDVPTLTPPADVTQEQADMAAAALSATGEELDLMFASADNATGIASLTAPAPGLELNVRAATTSGWRLTGPCNRAASGRHVCGTASNGTGLSLDRSYAFFDADTTTESFHEATTDSINFQSHISGASQNDTWTATVDRVADVTVAGDPTWDFKRLWNGTGEGTLNVEYTDGSASRSYDLSGSTIVTNVATGIPHSDNPWPLAGTIVHTFQGTRTGGASAVLVYTAVVTFNGQSVVPLDLGPDLDHLNNHICIDLDARKVANVTCRDD